MKSTKVKSKVNRFSMKYQIMLLCIASIVLAIGAVSIVTLPMIMKEMRKSTEAHMKDFVQLHSDKIGSGVTDIGRRMDVIVNGTEKAFDVFYSMSAGYEDNNKTEENEVQQAGQSDQNAEYNQNEQMGSSAEGISFMTLLQSLGTEMQRIVDNDGVENSEILIVDSMHSVINSTNYNLFGETIPDEDFNRYLSEAGKLHVETEYDDENDMIVVTYCRTLYREGKVDGLVLYKTSNLEINKVMQDYVLNNIPAPNVYILDPDGMIIAHEIEDAIGTTTVNPMILPVLEQVKAGTYKDETAHSVTFLSNGEKVNCSYVYIPEADWILGVNAYDADLYSKVNSIQRQYFISAFLVILVIAVLIVYLSSIFTKPLAYISKIISDIGDLNFSINIRDGQFQRINHKHDEIGDMSRSVERMILAIKGNLNEIKDSSEQVDAAALQLKSITNDISDKANDTSAITEQLSASMEETTASTNVITSDVLTIKDNLGTIKNQISKNADVTQEIMERAGLMMTRSNEAETKTRAAFAEIKKKGQAAMEQSKATAQINDLAKVIMDIADQTSLLALNASIEAARAGESGRGFAVVADEIGNLAQQSANTVNKITGIVEDVNKAVQNITECLSDSQNFVEKNVYADYANQMKTLESYGQDADNIHQVMNEIDRNTQSLFKTIEKMAESIEGINETIQEASIGVSDIVERNNAIGDLTSQSYEMVKETNLLADQLKKNVKAFVL